MEELTKAIVELHVSYGLNLRTIQKMVRDIYKNADDTVSTKIAPKATTKTKTTK